MKQSLLILAAAALTLALGACNTVKGLGKDIESVGQAGSRAVHR